MTVRFEDKDTGWSTVLEGVRDVENIEPVTVGFYDESNATKAAVNEYGTDRIPERPFMRTALDANASRYFDLFQAGLSSTVDGKGAGARLATRLGVEARNDIIESIQSGQWTPNAPSTIESKGSSKPLVDTGEMQRALTFKVGDDGEGE